MSYSSPTVTRAWSRRRVYRRRRHRLGLGLLALGLLIVTVTGGHHDGTVTPQTGSVAWPAQGQGALALGNGAAVASPGERPVPIASLAKVMTAYLVLAHYPLATDASGFTLTISPGEAAAEREDAAAGESVVAVRAGEQLTERQLLEALLIPSGNNIARTLAAQLAGSQATFITEMNAEARALGMGQTAYTDPSGFASSTVSTAADQLRILRQVMRFAAFRQIVAMDAVTLPVAGTVTNFDPLLRAGYAGKTGSDTAAGGCLAFFTQVDVGAGHETAAGVVLGQGQGSDTRQILAAAGDAAQLMVGAVAGRDVNPNQ